MLSFSFVEAVFFGVPTGVVLLFVFGFGVIIGSFLNVLIYRYHTGKSLGGSSHCLSCGVTLQVVDLFPLVSYVLLRGRCRRCRSYIPPRYFLVELLTGALFVAVVATISDPLLIGFSLMLMALLVVIFVYDLVHMVIPDALTAAAALLAIIYELYRFTTGVSIETLGYDLLAAAAASGFFFLLWWYSGGRWLGFGDVKLTFPLALLTGWQLTFSMIVLSFWVGAVIGLILIGYERLRLRGQPHLRFLARPLTMKSEVPFAPFLIIGFLLTYLYAVDVLTLMQYANIP